MISIVSNTVQNMQFAPAVDSQNPWMGLASFTEELQGYFHGREQECEELFRRVKRKSLTVLFSQSGLGKTSLLQAGLFPQLRREGWAPVPIRLDFGVNSPPLVDQVKSAIGRATGQAADSDNTDAQPSNIETLWEYFHRRRSTDDGHEPLKRFVLAFDQFEEIFTLGRDSDSGRMKSTPFFGELAALIENRPPGSFEALIEQNPELAEEFDFERDSYRILLSLREDYLPQLESLRPLIPSIAQNRMRLCRMSGAEALNAVIRPGGSLVSTPVAEKIVVFVARGARGSGAKSNGESSALDGLEVEPSLLSLVCRELNSQRMTQRMTQITAELLAGSSDRILQDFYERCLADQPNALRAFIEDELLTDSGYRENMALERARKSLAQKGVQSNAIETLVGRRLLHVEERLTVQRIELTHDILTDVVKRSRSERQNREAVLLAEQREREIREKLRKSRRKMAIGIGIAAGVLTLVSGLAIFSFLQWKEAEAQKQRALAEAALAETQKKNADELKRLAMDYMRSTGSQMYDLLNEKPELLLAYSNIVDQNNATLDEILKRDPENREVLQQKALNLALGSEAAQRLRKTAEAREKSDRALTLAGMLAKQSSDPATARAAALTYGIVAGALKALGNYDDAMKAAQAGLTLAKGIDPAVDAGAVERVAFFDQMLAEIQSAMGKKDDAVKSNEAGLKILSDLAAKEKSPRTQQLLSEQYLKLGDTQLATNDNEAARKSFEESNKIRRGLWTRNDTKATRADLAYSFEKLGDAYRALRDISKAREAYDNNIRMRASLILSPSASLDQTFIYNIDETWLNLSQAYNKMGDLEMALGDKQRTVDAYKESLYVAEELARRNPRRQYRVQVANTYNAIGNAFRSIEDHRSAVDAFEKMRGIEADLASIAGDSDAQQDLAFSYGQLGHSLLDVNRVSEAVENYRHKVEIYRQLASSPQGAKYNSNLASALGSLAFGQIFNLQPKAAIQAAEEGIRLDPKQIWILTNLAHGYLFDNQFEKARQIYIDNKAVKTNETQTFAEAVLDDFKEFKKHGLKHSDVEKIEKLLEPQ